jgi:hypothetical protein
MTKIHFIHKCRSVLLNGMFDEPCGKSPGVPTEQISHDTVTTAELIWTLLSQSEEIKNSARGVFVHALQQVVDSLIGGLRP